MQIKTQQKQLHDVLHMIATHPNAEPCIALILQMAQQAAHGASVSFISFVDPLLSAGDSLDFDLDSDTLEQIDGMSVDSETATLLCPVREEDELLGALVLGTTAMPSGAKRDLLAALIDALIIVLQRERSITQYKKLNRSQAEFIRIVSHDIRSPLTSMRGFAEMMGMVGPLNTKQAQFSDKVQSGIAQITALVDNIQDAGRFDPETGFYEMSRSQVDLNEMVKRVVSNQLIPQEKPDLTISVSVSDDVPIINADANMVERAITNLVDNAIKYTPNGGHIDALAITNAGSVIISVRDNGLGISKENQKQLFQRHVRLARPEHKRIKGTGLGLFIVKSVAQRHGGDAWVESAENVGSTFSFSIPLKGANLVVADTTGD
ncbi:MAG TPA: HAMP domain-containing sensor histidine kinase [Phototrophicaceae bacterium]|nr:HAMP domain-containing sensor histidine kinase [Phototrophicaceae bacterium]